MIDISKLSNVVLDGLVYAPTCSINDDNGYSDSYYYPDISGAYIASADYDNSPMNSFDLLKLNEQHPELVKELAQDCLSCIGF